MTDILFLAILAAFFGIAVLFVHGCERIIGPDVESEGAVDASDSEQVAA